MGEGFLEAVTVLSWVLESEQSSLSEGLFRQEEEHVLSKPPSQKATVT